MDPVAEHTRVMLKYPLFGHSVLSSYACALFALLFDSLNGSVAWNLWGGMLLGSLGWELTKFRMRRNATEYLNAHRALGPSVH